MHEVGTFLFFGVGFHVCVGCSDGCNGVVVGLSSSIDAGVLGGGGEVGVGVRSSESSRVTVIGARCFLSLFLRLFVGNSFFITLIY